MKARRTIKISPYGCKSKINTTAVLSQRPQECPFWVISGHNGPLRVMSALPPIFGHSSVQVGCPALCQLVGHPEEPRQATFYALPDDGRSRQLPRQVCTGQKRILVARRVCTSAYVPEAELCLRADIQSMGRTRFVLRQPGQPDGLAMTERERARLIAIREPRQAQPKSDDPCRGGAQP